LLEAASDDPTEVLDPKTERLVVLGLVVGDGRSACVIAREIEGTSGRGAGEFVNPLERPAL
jgi:hypothetical protein